MRFTIILTVILAATWLTLSGYFTNMLLTLGIISIAIVLWMCSRMKILDRETVPYHPFSISYYVWLFAEIAKANMQVVRAVLSPDLEVSPTMTKIPLPSDSDVALTMFSNSITLTPGTVSVDMAEDHILVHALLKEMSNPDDFKEMGDKSTWAVGDKIGTQ